MAARGAVVVVNHGASDLLEAHLARTAAGLDALVVVVDNSPSDAARARARELAGEHGWVLVETPNDGFGAGVNAGAAAALERGAQALLVVNPDLDVAASDAAALLAQVLDEPDVLVAPVVQREDGSTWFSGGSLDPATGRTRSTQPDPAAAVDWLSGACLAVSADAWRALGGFDPRFFLYWEDVDLSWRARAAGLRLAVRRDVVATHAVGGTQEHAGSRRKSDLYYAQNCRNRLLFAALHLDGRTRRRWALRAPGYARAVLLRGGRRQLLEGPGPVLAVTRGTLAGLRAVARPPARHGGR